MRRRQPHYCLLVSLLVAKEVHKAENRYWEGSFEEPVLSVEAAVGCAEADQREDLARRCNLD